MPVGEYVAQVVDASVSQPKSGDGWGVNLTWQVTEDEHEGRYVWQRITFQHSSVQAMRIGRRQFKDLCTACGVAETVTDVDVFKHIPCRIRLGIEIDDQGAYPDKNRVSRILPLEPPAPPEKLAEPKTTPPKAGPASAPQAAPKATSPAAKAKPWHKATTEVASKKTVAEDLGDEVPY